MRDVSTEELSTVDFAPADVQSAPGPTRPVVRRVAKPAQPKWAPAPSKPFSISYDGGMR